MNMPPCAAYTPRRALDMNAAAPAAPPRSSREAEAATAVGDDGAASSTRQGIPLRHDSKLDDDTREAAPALDKTLPLLPPTHSQPPLNAAAACSELTLPLTHAGIGEGASMAPLSSSSHAAAPASLHLETSIPTFAHPREPPLIFETPVDDDATKPSFTSPISIVHTTSSLRSNLSTNSISSHSPASTSSMLASPYLANMADITPLPSPIMSTDRTEAWQKHQRLRQGSAASARQPFAEDNRPARASSVSSVSALGTSPQRKKQYTPLGPGTITNMVASQQNGQGESHGRNRSISEFVPESLHNVRQRMVTIGSGDQAASEYQMHREAHLAGRRGLLTTAGSAGAGHPASILPTPPPSNTSVAESDDADDDRLAYMDDGDSTNYLHIHCGIHNRLRRFRQVRQLGQGTFSKVMLATSQRLVPNATPVEQDLDPSKLVAVKVVEHGPAGGADEERIEISLRREVEMLKSVSHPSLIHLKACETQATRTLLVLTYCPGGDLFELASDQRDLLTPELIQRMFAELISAVRYLHHHGIVHRDIKLENVLVNYTLPELRLISDPLHNPTPIVTLSDLGLSRRIPDPPALLTTRCGSEDYAAPEILLGQPYDGRLTDGWALGVLLYALLEGRLPFDAPPGKPDRSRNTHRIARCDWIWCRFGDDDGEWDASRPGAGAFKGARLVVEGLLKKVRMGRMKLEDVERDEWVQGGIKVLGGMQKRAQDLDELT